MANSNFGSILVIGYGNSLRSDDGAGCQVADIVASWHLPYVRSLTVHQLTPELAEPIAASELTIFIDAYAGEFIKKRDKLAIQVKKIAIAKSELVTHGNSSILTGVGHFSDPRSLLLLSQQIYGKTPTAYTLLLPAVNWEFGEQISAVTRKSIEQAVDFLRNLCTKLVSSSQC
ncbi:hydrogenase maturation protease [Pseudanabaena mucicola]|uniref:Hydrogenase maturation protease n=1 Tax=Pseudanabaena mucicola FACHB-723 TaxID=2692860 RepID=A0ABR7ZZG3_9CYAN|nr:hydrogenase maturation protease [Pseudanabaena mucicola]MBD2189235.1 hydrogenase maturation protease [Pseudanabaena mucicola FACHB-723]